MADDKDPKAPAEATPAAAAPEAEAKNPKKEGAKPKLSMASLQPREKLFLQILFFSFAILMVDLVMIHPISNYLQRLDDSIKLEEVVHKRLLILKHKTRILNEYRAIQPLFTETSVSQEEETATFLREIEKVSKEVDLFVTNINTVVINKLSEGIYEQSLDVEVKGGLKQVRNFMRVIESSNPFIRITAFNLKPQNKDAEELKVLFSIAKLGVKNSRPPVES